MILINIINPLSPVIFNGTKGERQDFMAHTEVNLQIKPLKAQSTKIPKTNRVELSDSVTVGRKAEGGRGDIVTRTRSSSLSKHEISLSICVSLCSFRGRSQHGLSFRPRHRFR